MKVLSYLALITVIATGLVFAQKARRSSPIQSMVDTERAFAKMSIAKGIRPSFMAFVAEDGILFRPRAVKGKQWMTEHPLPPSNKRPQLSWGPSYADMAQSGEMGYTFGPWEYKDDASDAKTSAFGHFVTIWKKQLDGTWKFAVDLGVSHPQVSDPMLPMQVSDIKAEKTPAGKMSKESAREVFIRRERAFSEMSSSKGAREAFAMHAADNVRLFREGVVPVRGKAAAVSSLPSAAGVWTWQPEAWDVSDSNDLAYSYGSYELKTSNATERGNYYRIWKRINGEFKVVVDLANPIPEK